MRIHYIGDLDDHTDERLAGIVMSHGHAMDVHNDELVEELLALPWFSDKIAPAVAMADHSHVLFEESAEGFDAMADEPGDNEEGL